MNHIGKHIVLYDGFCTTCSGFIKLIINLDKKDKYRFTSLHTKFSKKFINKNVEILELDSILFIENYNTKQEVVFVKSDAIVKIIANLNPFLKFFYVFKLLPTNLRNKAYDLIASKRKRFFGRKESCEIPGEEVRHKFL